MFSSTELSKILTTLYPERDANEALALFQTLDIVSYKARDKGCLFRPGDIAFDVPELRAFREFTLEAKAKFGLTNGFAILDYSLPRSPDDYTNAIYLMLDNALDNVKAEKIEQYARRLTNLYDHKDIANKIFDTNKIILSHRHYENFILSRTSKVADHRSDEYFIDLKGLEEQLNKHLQKEMHRVLRTEGGNYLKSLAAIYSRAGEMKRIFEPILRNHCSSLVCDAVLGGKERKVGGIKFEDVQSAFLTYVAFFLSIIPPDTKEFVYLPVQMVAGTDQTLIWVGGILLPFIQPSTREQRVALRNSAQVIVSSFYSAYTDALLLQSLEQAAQAQVMSRNMSHNLGSHALARIKGSHMRDAPEDSERLLGYLQERMDFVARVSTEWPDWREPVLFYGDLVRGFFKQGMLLNNLVADDGYVAEEKQIEFTVKLPNQSPMLFTYEGGSATGEEERYSEFRLQREGGKSTAFYRDLLVAIPGGPVGRQAFYGFLENAIRNAAKHNPGCQPLRVALELKECEAHGGIESTFYKFRYQDSVSNTTSRPKLVETIQDYLTTGLVNAKTRKPVSQAWGIQEMKVYARYLAHPFENEKDALTEEQKGHLLWSYDKSFPLGGCPDQSEQRSATSEAGLDGSNATDAAKVLTYSFGLQRPCLALIVGSCQLPGDEESRRRYGLQSFTEGWYNITSDLLRRNAPGLLYFAEVNEGESEDRLIGRLSEQRLWLPARVLIKATSSEQANLLREKLRQKGLSHRVRVDADISPVLCQAQSSTNYNSDEKIQQCLVDLARRWLIATAEERNFKPPFNVVIYFDRENTPYPQRWANLGKFVTGCGLNNLIKVFPVDKKQVSASTKGEDIKLSEPWKVKTLSWCKEDGREKILDSIKVEQNAEESTWLVLDNHGVARLSDVEFYQYIGAYSKGNSHYPNNREAFDRMMNVAEGFIGVLSLIQLVEACLLKVLVLDERVAGEILQLQQPDKKSRDWRLQWKALGNSDNYGKTIAGHFNEAGIDVAMCFDVIEGAQTKRLYALRADGELTCDIPSELLSKITIHDSQVIEYSGQSTDEGSLQNYAKAVKQAPSFDAVIIHKGLIEWLSESIGSGFNQDKFLNSLHAIGARVIITSGRGAQMEGSIARYPFVEFAVLENYLVRELSKASLGNVLMAVTGKE